MRQQNTQRHQSGAEKRPNAEDIYWAELKAFNELLQPQCNVLFGKGR